MTFELWRATGVRLDLPALFLAGLERQERASRDPTFNIEESDGS